MHEFRMTMCRAFVLYLIIALVAQKAGVLVGVRAIPSSLCAFGYGDNCERDSESCPASFYPPARAGDCAQCQMEGCAYCSYASKSECNFCQPGFYAVIETYPCEGPEGKCQRIKTCKRCKDPNCGYCTGDGSQCEDKGLVCKSHKAKAATKAKKVVSNEQLEAHHHWRSCYSMHVGSSQFGGCIQRGKNRGVFADIG